MLSTLSIASCFPGVYFPLSHSLSEHNSMLMIKKTVWNNPEELRRRTPGCSSSLHPRLNLTLWNQPQGKIKQLKDLLMKIIMTENSGRKFMLRAQIDK